MPTFARICSVVLLGAALCLATSAARAQGVLLQIRPRVGDTLQLRLDQQTELSSRRRGAGGSARTVVWTMRLVSRAIVEQSVSNATIVRTITDSARLTTTDEQSRALADKMARMLQGQSVRLRIAPDGSVALAESDARGARRDMSEIMAVMPAAFPRGPVDVGYSWTREMPLPDGTKLAPAGGAVGGWLHANFRLDSVSADRGLAYVSMRGEMSADPDARAVPGANTPRLESGVVTGTMLVDRQRGWLAETQFNIVAHSIVQLPDKAGTVMRFETRVTQRMKAVEKR